MKPLGQHIVINYQPFLTQQNHLKQPLGQLGRLKAPSQHSLQQPVGKSVLYGDIETMIADPITGLCWLRWLGLRCGWIMWLAEE